MTRIKYEVQDPYSFRCIPQVHGASWNAFYHLEKTVNTELNSVTDNPIVLENGKIIQQGKHSDLIESKGYYKELFEKQQTERVK